MTCGSTVDNSENRPASDPLAVMLEARSVALVGASPRPGSLGARMTEEVARSPSQPRTYLVNPRYDEIGGVRCYPGLADLPEPADLALLAVPDAALEDQVRAAAAAGARSAVIFGSAVTPSEPFSPGPGSAARLAAALPFPARSRQRDHDRSRGCASGSRRPRGTRGWPCAGRGAWGS